MEKLVGDLVKTKKLVKLEIRPLLSASHHELSRLPMKRFPHSLV